MTAILAHETVALLLSDDHFSVDGTRDDAWVARAMYAAPTLSECTHRDSVATAPKSYFKPPKVERIEGPVAVAVRQESCINGERRMKRGHS